MCLVLWLIFDSCRVRSMSQLSGIPRKDTRKVTLAHKRLLIELRLHPNDVPRMRM